ncbi:MULTISPECIES: sulfite exporter TauE/SafE family protein [unclassified Archaeoglobus]|jgi:hypothetical protein|uniref:sulfite exporter TauE/SafE family protein n=1 Tax=unclassified Archaeoglobus TaxID=2643606 RepID=UPI0025C0880E|nr:MULTISPECIES: sulfite exporter TauE/SafE family protein [unclassified Archaeoglobus]
MELFEADYLLLFVISLAVIGSAIVKTGVGVGAGIFLLPLLSLVLPPKTALGIGAPAMLISDIVGLKLYWKEWNSREALLIVPPSVIGVAVGVVLVKFIPSTIFRYWIGAFAVSFVLHNLISKVWKISITIPENWRLGRRSGIIFGFAGGFVSAVSHAGGAVLSVYLLTRKLEKRIFVGLFILFFVITNVAKTVGYVRIGILTVDLVLMVFVLSPLIVLGSLLGNHLNKKLSQEMFRTLVLVIILITGVKLLY